MKLSTLVRPALLAAFFGAATMAACSLNPQPIPPGEQAGDAGDKFGSGAEGSDASTPASAGDGGVTGGGNNDASSDADAGDQDANAEDAGDADTDAHDE